MREKCLVAAIGEKKVGACNSTSLQANVCHARHPSPTCVSLPMPSKPHHKTEFVQPFLSQALMHPSGTQVEQGIFSRRTSGATDAKIVWFEPQITSFPALCAYNLLDTTCAIRKPFQNTLEWSSAVFDPNRIDQAAGSTGPDGSSSGGRGSRGTDYPWHPEPDQSNNASCPTERAMQHSRGTQTHTHTFLRSEKPLLW